MRTTIDLPDDLLRRAKATAALRGMKLKELISQLLEQGLGSTPRSTGHRPMQRELPQFIAASGRAIPALSNSELEDLFLQEEMDRLGLG